MHRVIRITLIIVPPTVLEHTIREKDGGSNEKDGGLKMVTLL